MCGVQRGRTRVVLRSIGVGFGGIGAVVVHGQDDLLEQSQERVEETQSHSKRLANIKSEINPNEFNKIPTRR